MIMAAAGSSTGSSDTWTLQKSVAGGPTIYSGIWGGSSFYTVQDSTYTIDSSGVQTSTDGKTWTPATGFGTKWPSLGIVKGGGVYVMGSNSSSTTPLATLDLSTFAATTRYSFSSRIRLVAYDPTSASGSTSGTFWATNGAGLVLGGTFNTSTAAVISWVLDTGPGTSGNNTGAYSPSLNMTLMIGSSTTVYYTKTTSSGAWTSNTKPTTNIIYGSCWGNSMFVIVGAAGYIATSTDGINWTAASSGVSTQLNAVTWTGNRFIAVGMSGTIVTSTNGSTWTVETTSTPTDNFYGVFSSPTLAVAVGTNSNISTRTA